jgi:hypothetical protein
MGHEPFQPEALERMQRVFDAVCATLRLSPTVDDQVTKLVASRVITLADAGETDVNHMITLVLTEFLEPRGDRSGSRTWVRRRTPEATVNAIRYA